MAIIEEPMVEGVYAADLNDLQIRTKRETIAPSVGSFKKDEMFPVFEVFPEENGILWGRISSNLNGAPSRFVGLRVGKNIKAHLVKKFASPSNDSNLATSIDRLTEAIWALVNTK